MARVEEVNATIPMAEYCREYRNVEQFLTLCRQCKGFGKTWACPPFEQPIEISHYQYAHIFGEKIWVDSHIAKQKLSKEQLQDKITSILTPIRSHLDKKVLELERSNIGSRALFAGSCQGCPKGECTRPQGEPCIKPHKMRPSLESLGFDVGKTTSQLLGIELQWCNDHLPPYFTLVYALFSDSALS